VIGSIGGWSRGNKPRVSRIKMSLEMPGYEAFREFWKYGEVRIWELWLHMAAHPSLSNEWHRFVQKIIFDMFSDVEQGRNARSIIRWRHSASVPSDGITGQVCRGRDVSRLGAGRCWTYGYPQRETNKIQRLGTRWRLVRQHPRIHRESDVI